ncbi:hypothetical protein MKX01_030506 [Papaver californicum]|nr:hypothetical protein MKX01_030506 [Papaver californicum]
MMASVPNFKARPVTKKILEAPTLPALPRSTPHLPELQEFHLKKSARVNQHAETSTESSHQAMLDNSRSQQHLLVKNFASSKMCTQYLLQIGLNAAQNDYQTVALVLHKIIGISGLKKAMQMMMHITCTSEPIGSW